MNMQGNYPSGEPEEMPQEEQARLLVEPTFDHRIDDEADLLRAEFGPPDKDGGYGRGDYEYTGRADS